jgi:secreted trypsin-like serine protease
MDTLVNPGTLRLTAALLLALAMPTLAIVNGESVTTANYLRQFPWAAVLVSPENGQVCGATLVSPTFLVTAGHCTNKSLSLVIGGPDRRKARTVAIVDAIRHPRYSGKPGEYDIGLIRIAEPQRTPVVRLPSEREEQELLRSAPSGVILGWGHQKPGGGFVDVLSSATARIARYELQGTLILFESVPAAVCQGDSGGPLVVRDARNRPVLLGIASVTAGDLCSKGGGIAGYTNVSQLVDFIRDNVPDLPKPT